MVLSLKGLGVSVLFSLKLALAAGQNRDFEPILKTQDRGLVPCNIVNIENHLVLSYCAYFK